MAVVKNFQMFIAGNKVDCEDERVVEEKELIELAKKYGTDDSPSFINGVLAKFA